MNEITDGPWSTKLRVRHNCLSKRLGLNMVRLSDHIQP